MKTVYRFPYRLRGLDHFFDVASGVHSGDLVMAHRVFDPAASPDA